MPDTVSADEAFEMAMRIEQRGEAFYRAAAAATHDDDVKRLLRALAQWEGTHRDTFSRMRDNPSRSGAVPSPSDLRDQAEKYLWALTKCCPALSGDDSQVQLTGSESAKEVLQVALDLEKATILLYVGVRDLVSEPAEKQQIDQIIHEEMRHVTMLSTGTRS